MPAIFGPQNMDELMRQLPSVYMNHVFYGTGWADDANLFNIEMDTWACFDDRAANVHEAPWIFNGTYELRIGAPETYFEIKVHTVQGGNLNGRRVLKYKQESGRWKAFATLRRNGTIFVWSAFRGEEHRVMVVATNFAFSNMARDTRTRLVMRSNEGTRNAFMSRNEMPEQTYYHMDLGHVRLQMWSDARCCHICNSVTRRGICYDHPQDQNEAVPPHAGTFRSIGPAEFLLSENGTGLVR